MGRSNILPRQTLEHRLHLAETVSHEGSRNSWKFGGDALLTSIYDFFPHQQSGEYLFYPVKVDPFTFHPVQGGLELSPLRAYAHEIPHYYLQNFGSAASHPDTNEYAAFAQDTIRATSRLAVNLGVRWDLQTFTHAGLVSNPLFPPSGKVPFQPYNFAPRAGLAYSFGTKRPFGRARGIRHLLCPHSADLQLDHPNGKRNHQRQSLPEHQQLLRPPGISGVSQSSRRLSAVLGKLHVAGWIHARGHSRSFCVCAEFRDATGAAGERHAGKRNCGSHDGRVVGAVGAR